MDAIVLVIWAVVGIMQAINCSRKIKAGWIEYWCCYAVLMVQLLENMF